MQLNFNQIFTALRLNANKMKPDIANVETQMMKQVTLWDGISKLRYWDYGNHGNGVRWSNGEEYDSH